MTGIDSIGNDLAFAADRLVRAAASAALTEAELAMDYLAITDALARCGRLEEVAAVGMALRPHCGGESGEWVRRRTLDALVRLADDSEPAERWSWLMRAAEFDPDSEVIAARVEVARALQRQRRMNAVLLVVVSALALGGTALALGLPG